ncbi:MAG: ATP-binding cassette domain-containing protein [Gordonibacter sp.]|nr:ATP-binding cassette domain-containing protein [Gordonibacter sp.]
MHIKIEKLSKQFEGTEVLRGINFDDNVSTLAIIGPSGGGKSTLLRIVGGLLTPTSGTVSLDGATIDYTPRTLPNYRAQLGFVFQNSGLFHHLTALENIALPLRVVHGYTSYQAEERAAELLVHFGLDTERSKHPAQLSGGQQQRVAIARAVAARPKMLLLDEPTSALDPEFTNDVLDTIHSLKETGTRFIVVTHEMGFARHACDKVAFLHGGSLLEYGDSTRLFDHPETPELQRFLSKLLEWSI